MRSAITLDLRTILIMKRPPLDSPNRSQLRRGSFLIVLSRRLAVLVFFLCAALLVQPCAAFPFQWEYTGSLNIARLYHTATLLSDGRVLVAAGVDDTGYPAASTELYDPATGNWTFTGSLNTGRSWHTATLLSDGRILIVGGYDQDGALASAELYDPATGTWTVTGSLNIARAFHTATLLANGEVLAAGGVTLASAELYDPATATWTFTGSLNAARDSHTATLLADGEVLVAGGESEEPVYRIPAGTELYDPATGTWILTGSLNTKRYSHTATLLSNGDVLVVGGIGGPSGRAGLASAELYASATGDWNFTGSFNTTRGGHTATLLVDGSVSGRRCRDERGTLRSRNRNR
jgi:Galactose oxidase, central domain